MPHFNAAVLSWGSDLSSVFLFPSSEASSSGRSRAHYAHTHLYPWKEDEACLRSSGGSFLCTAIEGAAAGQDVFLCLTQKRKAQRLQSLD